MGHIAFAAASQRVRVPTASRMLFKRRRRQHSSLSACCFYLSKAREREAGCGREVSGKGGCEWKKRPDKMLARTHALTHSVLFFAQKKLFMSV